MMESTVAAVVAVVVDDDEDAVEKMKERPAKVTAEILPERRSHDEPGFSSLLVYLRSPQ